MELTDKTTILLPAALHKHLKRIAARRKVSMGQLIRDACEEKYGLADREEREAVIESLQGLDLPVANPAEMKAQSVSPPKDIEP